MHYYQHNIKDFNNATRHLTDVERSLYRDAIELYYSSEKPLPSDFETLFRRLMAVSDEKKSALKYVVSEFFYLDDGDFRNKRCDEEIAKYHSKNASQSIAGKASAEARRKKAEAKKEQTLNECATVVEQTLNECATNKEPITKNKEQVNKKSTKKKPRVMKPQEFKDFFAEYPAHRKGGTNAQAWKAWQMEGLKVEDATLALSWLRNAALSTGDWATDGNGQYILGITKFIQDRFWLTPVPLPPKPAVKDEPFNFHEANRDTSWIKNVKF